MHPSVMAFVERTVARYGLAGKSVLEVGSLNVNGSVRGLFHGEYVATDMRPGPGVDEVVNAHRIGRRWGYQPTFDVVVSTEMLEHDDAPWVSLLEMGEVVREDGLLLLTCRGYDERGCFPLHDYPQDLWRFSCDGLRRLLEQTGWAPETVEPDPECPGVFAVARAAR